jgi:ferric-dicitrate binding protein FerR (iron transport regulator)
MNDRYLWDRTGTPDPEVERLERLLAPLGERGVPCDACLLPARTRTSAWRRTTPLFALAATIVLMIVVQQRGLRPNESGWTVEASPHAMANATPGTRLGTGARVATGAGQRLRLAEPRLGTVDLGPETRVRVLRAEAGRHVLALDRGTIDAEISAPPGVFVVETPAARAVDLGCRYTLSVTPDGAGLLHVTLGWVALTERGRESLVPSGAMCATRGALGPGTPWFEGATPAFVAALATIDAGAAGGEADAALTTVLADARPLDGLTLWHLLGRVDRRSAARVFDRLAALAPPSSAVTRAGILASDRAQLAAWWEQIGLGDLEEIRQGLRK